jgi:uncharacterized protein (DUF1778 family)
MKGLYAKNLPAHVTLLDCISICYTIAGEEDYPMATARPSKRRQQPRKSSPLMVRLDDESKTYLTKAAELRGISLSDYVRTVMVAQAKREVLAAREQTISLSPDEQLAFWNALNETPKLTAAQRRLGALMRGDS